MTRCCLCDHDHIAPSAYSESIEGKKGRVHYRKRLKDYYCEGCYSSVLVSIKVGDLRDAYQTTIIDLMTTGLPSDYDVHEDNITLHGDTPTMPMRELV